jgi:hypothetical protein
MQAKDLALDRVVRVPDQAVLQRQRCRVACRGEKSQRDRDRHWRSEKEEQVWQRQQQPQRPDEPVTPAGRHESPYQDFAGHHSRGGRGEQPASGRPVASGTRVPIGDEQRLAAHDQAIRHP